MDLRNLKNKKAYYEKWVQLALILYLSNAVFKYFLPGILTKILPILAVALVCFGRKDPFKLRITRVDKPFLIFGLVWGIGCIYSNASAKGLGYVLSFAIAILFSIFIAQYKLNEKFVIKFLAITCTILISFVIIQPMAPEFVSLINSRFSYSAQEYSDMSSWARVGMYSGLFPDRAPAAFYSSILIGTGVYYLYRNRRLETSIWRKLFGLIFICLGSYSMLLTAKRGLLLGSIIAAFITYLVYKRTNNESIIKICIGVAAICAVVYFVVINLDAAQVMLERLFQNDNFFTNRLDIYSNMYRTIESHPIFGTGTASAFNILGIGGHNIYLTVLMENGIIGFLLFIFAVLSLLITTIKNTLSYGRNGNTEKLPIMFFSLYIQVFFIVYGFSGNPLYDNYILYFYIFALVIVKNMRYHFKLESR